MADRRRGRRAVAPTSEKDHNSLMFWRPEESVEQARLVPDAYRSSLFGFVLYKEEDEDWWLSATLYRAGSQLAIGSLTLEPNTFKHPDRIPPGGIGSAQVRKIKVGDLLDRALREVGAIPDRQSAARELVPELSASFDDLGLGSAEEALARQAAQEAVAHRPRRGRPKKDDAFFRQVAEDYLDILKESGSRGALRRLADNRGYSREAARDWVAEARRREFLTAGTPGKAGAARGRRLPEVRAQEMPKPARQKKGTRST